MTTPTITPTIGRNVWYYPSGTSREQHATVIDVHMQGLVNLFTVNHGGTASAVTSVPHASEHDPSPTGPHWRWMPYQLGQAKGQPKEPDVPLVKLEENGVRTEAGLARDAETLATIAREGGLTRQPEPEADTTGQA